MPEAWWQDFFDRNHWIFGYGLNYVVIRPVVAQPNYGGAAITGAGAQHGDFLGASEAALKFTVLVEIKKPNTLLLKRSAYRTGAWPPSDELAGGISQVQENCRRWDAEARSDQNRDLLEDSGIFTIQPQGILVVGHLEQLVGRDQRTSFQLLRRNLVNPQILTFDELYERAKFITEHHQQRSLPAR